MTMPKTLSLLVALSGLAACTGVESPNPDPLVNTDLQEPGKVDPPGYLEKVGTVELRCSLMIDFPGDKVSLFKEIDPLGLVKLGLNKIGGVGLDKANPSGVLHTATVETINGIVDPIIVRGELDKMVEKYHALRDDDDVRFEPLVDLGFNWWVGTPYAKANHYCYTMEELRTARDELPTVGLTMSGAEISCIRYMWRDGRLVAIYNYVLVPVDGGHLPKEMNVEYDGNEMPVFEKTEPVYCAVCEFDIEHP